MQASEGLQRTWLAAKQSHFPLEFQTDWWPILGERSMLVREQEARVA